MKDDLASGVWRTVGDSTGPRVNVRRSRIDVLKGPDVGTSASFHRSHIRIGGKATNDLCLTDSKVSGLHLEIRLDETGYRLRDLESTNGTYVQGMRVRDVYVEPGTTICIGNSELHFQALAASVPVQLAQGTDFPGIIGESVAMQQLFAELTALARTDVTILIEGETGTGKELVAEGIHNASPRHREPFVVVDCSAIPANLFESVLFGHERGAFTGANAASTGLFEQANGGTIFFDELGELPVDMQPKLLRAVQSRSIRKVGGDKTISCDLRFVAATNRDLAVEVNRGTFREDLYYRFAVANVQVPPLRDRKEDIGVLIQHFLATLPYGEHVQLPAQLIEDMHHYYWPGNVRELRNAVERAIALPDRALNKRRGENQGGNTETANNDLVGLEIDIQVPFKVAKQQFVDEFDTRFITQLLEAHGGNVAAAARASGIDRVSIYKIINRLGIQR